MPPFPSHSFARVALPLVVLLLAAPPARAAINFDAASRSATAASGQSSLSWEHAIASGTDRVLVVGVAIEDESTTDAAITSVTYRGVALTSVPGSKRSGGGTGIVQTQLFYLLDAAAGGGGTGTVIVTTLGPVAGLCAGAVSLSGVSQVSPQSVATNVDTSGFDAISTNLPADAAGSWVVDVVASGKPGIFTPASGQIERWDVITTGMSAATSTEATPASGSITVGWSHTDANRIAHSVVSLAPSVAGAPSFTLATRSNGPGTVARSPAGTNYAPGTVVTLTATASAGFAFSGWTGDLAGSTDPAIITMSADRSVVATFAPLVGGPFALTTSVTGQGAISRTPDATSYPAGATVTLAATADAGYRFTGWTGDLSGSANPGTIAMVANRSVVATFARAVGSLDFNLYGFAAVGGGTTGGAGGPTVDATTLDQLRAFCAQDGPLVIRVAGTITGNEAIRVSSNKSILGRPGAHLIGLGFVIGRSSQFGEVGNVIVRNLIMEKALAPIDKIAVVYGGHHVWIDHNEFLSDLDHGIDFYDGQVDITHAADFITLSWNVFHDHFKNSLVGHSDSNGAEDTGHLRVTYHHNLFTRVAGRNPSIRFGTGHVYDNYYIDVPDYGIASRERAQIRVENNYFDNVSEPIRADTSLSKVAGFVNEVDTNTFVRSGSNSITTSPGAYVPPYPYPLDPVASVPVVVTQGAGVGKVTF